MQYVAMVRDYLKRMTIEDAVPKVVDGCIEKGILKKFLLRNKAEVAAMCIFEYNEEELQKMRTAERRGTYAEGHAEGVCSGIAESILAFQQEYERVPEELRKRILEEKNKDLLKKWLKIAASVESAEEFAIKIK